MIFWDKKEGARFLAEQNQEVWALTHSENHAVSNYGRVASKTQGEWRQLRGSLNNAGYLTYGIEGKTFLGHRLVVLAFDGQPPTEEHTDVRHLDGNKSNNELSNLRWGTRSENMSDVLQHRLERKKKIRERQIEIAKEQGVWFGGRTWDTTLVDICFRLEAENKIRLADVAELLGVSTDVAHNIRTSRSVGYQAPQEVAVRYRRNPAQSSKIKELVAQGLTREQINELSREEIGNELTHQDFYYFKVSVHPGSQFVRVNPPVLHGENHPMSKITETRILDAISKIENGEFKTVTQVQNFLGLSKTTTYEILSGRSWSHIPRSAKFKEQLAQIQRRRSGLRTEQRPDSKVASNGAE